MQQKAHFLIIMFLILVTTNCFIAQTLDWYEVKPDGENDRTWSVALSDNGNVVAASCPQGLFLSGNGGYTWSKVYTYGGPISMSGDGKVILCNTGVFSLSTNGGSTWTQVSPPGAGICDIVNVSHNGNVIAVQFLYDFAYISFDKGVTWKKISPTIKDLYSIALNSDGSKIIITKIDTAFISINNGDSWTILPLPSSTQVRATWRAKMSPNGNTVILWNERELFLSTNGGTSWQLKWRNTDPYSTVGIKVVDMNSNGQFIAACGFANVMYSTDWGDSWTTQPIVNTSSLWRDIAIDESGTKIIAGQAMGRVFVTGLSAYQELPWVRIQPTPDTTTAWRTIAVNPSFEYMLVARSSSKNGRIFLSTNRGTQWNELRPLGDVNYYWTNSAISSDGRTMYLLSAEYDGGLFLSKDYGSTWSDIRPDGSTYRDWWRTISLSENGNIAFVGGSKFYKSTDGGVTWVQIQLSTGSKYFDVSAISSDGSKVIVGGTYGKLFYSSDTGKTWTELTIPNVTSRAWSSITMNSDGNKLLLIADQKILYSTDRGNNWQLLKPLGKETGNYSSVTMSDDGRIIIAAEYGGVIYISGNSGNSWSIVNPIKFQNKYWQRVVCNRSGSKLLAIARDDGYVYQSDIIVSVDGIASLRPMSTVLYNNYPNPFNPATTIRYCLQSTTSVRLVVYDLLGREVKTLVNEVQQAGEYTVPFYAHGLSSGVYFYKIITPEFSEMKKMVLLK